MWDNQKTPKINEISKISLIVPGLSLWIFFFFPPPDALGGKTKGCYWHWEKLVFKEQKSREDLGSGCATAFGLILLLRFSIWGTCEDFILLSILLQTVVCQDLSLIFRVTSWAEIIGGRHLAYWFFRTLGKGTFISNRGNGCVNYCYGFLHHWEVCYY